MSDSAPLTAARVPNVYFIDDSATMREVMKIAFRKEHVNVITCADAATALAQFEEVAPDAVITDVIMPDKDGYEVCDYIKQHEEFARTPVILMSGVVNKSVAERATAVKADELIRKPFHPQDLIGRVKGLLGPKFPSSPASAAGSAPVSLAPPPAAKVLTNFFAPALNAAPMAPPSAGTSPFQAITQELRALPLHMPPNAAPVPPVPPVAPAANPAAQRTVAAAPPPASSIEVQKLRNEVRRLESLVKKLQAELEASREYCASLETHVKTLQD